MLWEQQLHWELPRHVLCKGMINGIPQIPSLCDVTTWWLSLHESQYPISCDMETRALLHLQRLREPKDLSAKCLAVRDARRTAWMLCYSPPFSAKKRDLPAAKTVIGMKNSMISIHSTKTKPGRQLANPRYTLAIRIACIPTVQLGSSSRVCSIQRKITLVSWTWPRQWLSSGQGEGAHLLSVL